jgi:hypothetical protein
MTSHSVGIVGARGHTGAELIRLIARHPSLELGFVSSRELAGQPVRDHIEGFTGELRCENMGHDEVAAKGMGLCVAEHQIGGGHWHLAETTLAHFEPCGPSGDRTERTQRLAKQVEFAGTAAGRKDHDAAHRVAAGYLIGSGLDAVTRRHLAHPQTPWRDTHDPEETFAAFGEGGHRCVYSEALA